MPKYDVFISYSHRDMPIANKICAALDRAGITYFIDRDGIGGGMDYTKMITDAISNSTILLFLASKNSYQSRYAKREITYAIDRKPKESILPYIIDSTELPEEIQFLFADINWRNIKHHPIESVLIEDLCRLLGRRLPSGVSNPSPVPPPPPTGPVSFWERLKKRMITINKTVNKKRKSRSSIINLMIDLLIFLVFCGMISVAFGCGFIFWPASIVGLFGIYLLLFNKEDGVAYIAAASLLWTLANAYRISPSQQVFRFYQEGNPLIVWLPMLVAILTFLLLFIPKNGKAWWKKCKMISGWGVIILIITGVIWIYSIYFDATTKLGLTPNIRYYINQIFN